MSGSLSPDNKVFVVITADSRLIFIDATVAKSSQKPSVISEANHLTRKYQCHTWGLGPASGSDASTLFLFLGCFDGTISVFNAKTHAFVTSLNTKTKSPIVSLAVDQHCRRLFSTTGDFIHEWDLTTATPSISLTIPITSPVVSSLSMLFDDIHLLYCSHLINVFNLPSSTVTHSITAHPQPVSRLVHVLTKSGLMLVSSSADRFINVFSMNSRDLFCTFISDSRSQYLSAFAHDNYLFVCSVSIKKVLSFFVVDTVNNTTSTPLSPHSTVSIQADSGDIMAASVENVDIDRVNVVIGRHVDAMTNTQIISINLKSSTHINLAPLAVVEQSSQSQQKSDNHFVVDLNTDKTAPITDNRKTLTVSNQSLLEDHQLSIGQQLELLQSSTESRGQSKSRKVAVSTVLKQALLTNDNRLIYSSMMAVPVDSIKPTISQLNDNEALTFLSILIALLDENPSRCSQLLPWIKSILMVFATSIMINPESAKILHSMKALLSMISSSHDLFSSLSAKLELTLSLSKHLATIHNVSCDAVEPIMVDLREEEEEGEMSSGDELFDDDLMNDIINMDD
ncbi:hypothetical protein RCL1_008373 [Eukaryota sp. TZLM3-RCL]